MSCGNLFQVMVGDSIFFRWGGGGGGVKGSLGVIEGCKKGSIPLDLEQTRPHLSTEVITDTGWMLSSCLRNIDESLLQCRLIRSCMNITFLSISRYYI